jgi:hypothetical protein
MKLKKLLPESSSNTYGKEELINLLNKNKSHFASFLKPKSFWVHDAGNTVTILPASKSFSIKIDFKNEKIDASPKPPYPESVSYTEIMQYVKLYTKFK